MFLIILMMTVMFYGPQGSNSTNYIQNAFQLLLPVLQISHIQSQHCQSSTEPAAQTQQ